MPIVPFLTLEEPAMTALFHRLTALSIGLAALSLSAPVTAEAVSSPFWGRWKIASNGEAPKFSSRGIEYKTIDIAPCGKDFCGVSVRDNGQCGAVLFRFLMKRADGKEELRGHGKWGKGRTNVLIWLFQGDTPSSDRQMQLYLGNGYDFGERSANMPKFDGYYRHSGAAKCKAR
jgi:hypothetical protein